MQFGTLFPVHNPGKRAHPQNKIWVSRKTRILETPCFFATLSQRNAKNPTQKNTNFRNTMFLHYLEPEKCQKSYPEEHEFRQRHNSSVLWARESPKPTRKTRILYQTALIDPSNNAKESIRFSRILHIVWNTFINPTHTNQTTTWEHLVAWFLNCRPIVTHSDSSTLAQDTVLNCYKKPAHYYYQISNFFRRPTSSCVVF